jgi:hypothetical protein
LDATGEDFRELGDQFRAKAQHSVLEAGIKGAKSFQQRLRSTCVGAKVGLRVGTCARFQRLLGRIDDDNFSAPSLEARLLQSVSVREAGDLG